MKKIFITICCLSVFIVNCFPQANNDKLMNERNGLYQKYESLVNPDKKPTHKETEAVIDALKALVIKDTEIISKSRESEKKSKEANDSLNKKIPALEKDVKTQKDQNFIYLIAAGASLLLCVVFLILMFVYISKCKKLKKTKISEDMNDVIAQLHKEKEELEVKIKDLEAGHQSDASENYEKQDLQISIVEKLHRLKEIGAITEEEFGIYKQNFLG